MSHKHLSHLLLLAGGVAGVGVLGLLGVYAGLLALRASQAALPVQYWALLAFVCIIAAAYGAALWQYMRISCRIGRDRSFCRENVRSMRWIARLMGAAAGMWAVLVALQALLAIDLATETLFIVMLCLASAAIALVAYVLEHLLHHAVQLQEDSELTI